METLKLFTGLFLLSAAYLFMWDNDYHKSFDKQTIVRYNCDILNMQEVPQEVIDKCKVSERNYVYIKTY